MNDGGPDGHMRMWKLGTICRRLIDIELAMALFVLGVMALSALLGLSAYDVESGSMEPALEKGSLAWVAADVPAADVDPGSVIAFAAGDVTVLHRVVENNREKELIVTKGDANEEDDPAPVSYGNVRCVVFASIPGIGSALRWTRDNTALTVSLMAGMNVLLVCIAGVAGAANEKARRDRPYRDAPRRKRLKGTAWKGEQG